jgi:signal transduction histidine kinase/ligand-binding sensor domain-containing protein/CheY-like chemotaxis protein
MVCRFRFLVAFALAILMAGRWLLAQARPPVVLPDGAAWVAQHFHTGNGLPQNSIGDLLQARSGYLWVATFGGLCRFDGREWRVFDTSNTPGLPGNRVLRLFEDRDGELWLGVEGAGLLRWRDGNPVRLAGWHGAVVTSIAQWPDGTLVAASEADVFEVARAADRVRPLYPQALPGILRLLVADDCMYAAGHRGLLALHRSAPQLLVPGLVRAVAALPRQVLLLARERGLQTWSAEGGLETDALVDQAVFSLHASGQGDLWYGTATALTFRPHHQPAASQVLPLHHSVRAMANDAAGGLWIGSIGGGLLRLRTAGLVAHGAQAGLPLAGQNAVAVDRHGRLHVACYAGLFRAVDGRFGQVPGMPTGPCTALHPEPDGSLWVGQEGVLVELRPDQDPRVFRLPDGGVLVHTIGRVDGELWVGSGKGLSVLRDGQLVPHRLHPALSRGVTFLKVDAAHRLWLAGPDYCLRISTDRRHTTYLRAGIELPGGGVRGILIRPCGDAWLAIYGGGLAWLPAAGERVVRTLDRRHGLHDHGICNVADFGDEILLGSNRGMYWLDTRQLDQVAAGHGNTVACRPVAGPSDPSVEASGGFQPASAIVGNTAYLCGIGPLLQVTRTGPLDAVTAPACHVERILAGGREHGAENRFLAPVGARSLAVRLAACEFDAPEQVRFRWRLLPGDGRWSALAFHRDIQLEFARPGDYQLEAEAVAAGGASGPPAILQLAIPTVWHEEVGARIGLVGIALLLGLLVYRFGTARALHRELQLQQLVDQRTAALRHAQDNLEHRVQARTAALKLALERIDANHRERGRMERELELLRRMESLGQLAGGIAHDFNNLLTVVLGNATMLELELSAQPQQQELAVRIREAGERGRRMTRHLLSMASRQTVAPVALDLNQQVAGIRRMLEDLCGPGITLQLELAAAPMTVLAAPSQIEQILMNLAVNARDAMPGGGRLTIAVRPRGRMVELSVADTGTGMTAAVRDRAFEPFFTTKDRKLGTGLGLSTVYGITKQLQGEVAIESEPGCGTICRCCLPLAPVAAALPPAVLPTPAGDLPRQVLLVDDEGEVRRVLRALLEQAGCRVAEAASGDAALAWLAQPQQACDLVLSDVRMPGPVGVELVAAMRQHRPGLPVVFLTGHAEAAGTLASLRQLGIEVVSKPPEQGEVLGAVRRAMRTVVAAPLSTTAGTA